jgi:hypothetical protein
MNKLGVILISVILGGLLITGLIMYVGYNNKEVSLRSDGEAAVRDVNLNYDNMWKIIKQKGQVSDAYKDAFDTIYTKLISSRYDKDSNLLFKFITEANPNFDVSLYKDLSNSIEGLRNAFTLKQERVVDILNQHNKLRKQIPASWFVGSRPEIVYKPITSTITDQVVASGHDDDVNVFDRKK